VPSYDVRCRVCGVTFEIKRPMAQADAPATCPNGHDDTIRLLPTIAVTGLAAAKAAPTPPCGAPATGGCCGGGACSA
jgi:putative FmdB family regulatory protein